MVTHSLAMVSSGALHAGARVFVALGLWSALGAGPAFAQVKKCESLRAEIESRLSWPKGSYRLEILPREERTDGKFLGQCEAGSKKIVAIRSVGATEAPAAAAAVATAPVAAAPVVPARPTLIAPDRAAVVAVAPAAATVAVPDPTPTPMPTPAPTTPAPAPAAPTVQAEPPPATVADATTQLAAPAERVSQDKKIKITLKDRVEPGEGTPLDIELDIGDAVRQIRKELAGRGESVATENIFFESIEARVVGSKLDVISVDRNPQAVRAGIPARWSFFLNPEEEGKKKIKVVLTVELGKGSSPVELYSDTLDLVVERSAWDEFMLFINKNLQWLAATVLVPLAGWWWKSRKPATA
jgi:Protein of unknown function (DUF1161)